MTEARQTVSVDRTISRWYGPSILHLEVLARQFPSLMSMLQWRVSLSKVARTRRSHRTSIRDSRKDMNACACRKRRMGPEGCKHGFCVRAIPRSPDGQPLASRKDALFTVDAEAHRELHRRSRVAGA